MDFKIPKPENFYQFFSEENVPEPETYSSAYPVLSLKGYNEMVSEIRTLFEKQELKENLQNWLEQKQEIRAKKIKI